MNQARLSQRTIWIALSLLGALTVLNWSSVLPVLRGLASQLYGFGGSLYALIGQPLNVMRLALGTNPFAPLLLGIMGATAPCQLSTGAISLAYVAQDRRDGGALQRALAYTAARVLFTAWSVAQSLPCSAAQVARCRLPESSSTACGACWGR